MSSEIVNSIQKVKLIENIIKKLYSHVVNNTKKEFASVLQYLLSFTRFLSIYAYNESARKFLCVNY